MRNQNLIVSPSFLSADFADAQNELEKVVSSGVDYLHLDVMDGAFVPNITFGPKFIADLRKKTDLVFDVHLMVEEPERYIKAFADAGSDIITIHQEATKHLHRALSLIKECGKECGVAINPATPVEMILPILDMVDYVLIMSVNPGFGGQKFIPSTLRKVEYLAAIREREGYDYLIKECGKECGVAINPATPVEMILPILDMVDYVLIMSVNPGFGGQKFIPSTLRKVEYLAAIREREGYDYLINIDGGISEKTIREVAYAGIDMAVSGSAFFKAENPAEFVDTLVSIASEARR